MAIGHRFRLTRNFDSDCTAEALAFVQRRHSRLPLRTRLARRIAAQIIVADACSTVLSDPYGSGSMAVAIRHILRHERLSPRDLLHKDIERKNCQDANVGGIDDLTNPQIHRHTGEDIGLLFGQALLFH